jgi:hypothetical protein
MRPLSVSVSLWEVHLCVRETVQMDDGDAAAIAKLPHVITSSNNPTGRGDDEECHASLLGTSSALHLILGKLGEPPFNVMT